MASGTRINISVCNLAKHVLHLTFYLAFRLAVAWQANTVRPIARWRLYITCLYSSLYYLLLTLIRHELVRWKNERHDFVHRLVIAGTLVFTCFPFVL
jgi:hypothetical protein